MTAIGAAARPARGRSRRSTASREARAAATIGATFVSHAAFWLLVWAIGPTLFGWQSVALLSGSMSPLLGVGDIVVAEPYDGSALGPGTVVVFHAAGSDKLTTHRIVAVLEDGTYQTRGDANAIADSTPVPASAIVGVGRLRVPLVGLPMVWWQTGAYAPLVATLAGLALAAAFRGHGAQGEPERPARSGRAALAGRLLRFAVALAASILVASQYAGAVYAATTQDAGNAWGSARIFDGTRSFSPRTIGDASNGGTAVNASDPLSYAGDTLMTRTGNWASSYSSSRYFELSYGAPLAEGVAVTGAAFAFDFGANAGSETVCFYFEVRRASTSAVLATYGSAGSPIGCAVAPTFQSISTPIPVVTTTDIANDLAIRIYAAESNAKPMFIDRATVTGSTAYQSFVLYEISSTDASDGTPTTTPWSLHAVDANAYLAAQNWTNAYNAARYLRFTFGAYVPAGATVTDVTLTHTWKGSAAGKALCYFIEVYNGATLLGSHGSSGSPYRCDSTAAYVTDTIALPEAATVANANAVTIKLHAWDANTKKSSHDLLRLAVSYSLP